MATGTRVIENKVKQVITKPPVEQIEAFCYPVSMNNRNQWDGIPCLVFTFFKSGRFNPVALQLSADNRTNKMGFKTQGVMVMRMPDNGVSNNLTFDIGGTSDGFVEEFLRGTISGYKSGGVQGALEGGVKATVNEVELNVSKASGAYATNLGSNKTISSNKGVHGFNDVQNRSFTFVWRIVPQSQAELKEVGRITKFLERVSNIKTTGSVQNRTTMEVPSMVQFEERVIGQDKDRPRYTSRLVTGWCHISNLRITPISENGYITFAGTAGDPGAVEIEISFKEITKPTATLFENGNADGGWKYISIDGSDIVDGG
ncbi:hypothetical protein ACKC5Q_05080 [Aeromonas dhakensis]|uniref:hypothetical protein n=1 Tax=Aeromonas dhakensis TaxID=196024 RepID=UPI0038B53DE9